jgi:oligopeptidase B
VNLRPDLFKAAIAQVPFVDVVTTILDPTLPLTAIEWEEWGNPQNPDFYHYMKSYSPYDNVEAKDYPAMLITAGFNDPRVAYWEPAKWAAKLRSLKTDQNVLLLKTNLGAGHGGASGRYERLKEISFEYAFLLEQWGLSDLP